MEPTNIRKYDGGETAGGLKNEEIAFKRDSKEVFSKIVFCEFTSVLLVIQWRIS